MSHGWAHVEKCCTVAPPATSTWPGETRVFGPCGGTVFLMIVAKICLEKTWKANQGMAATLGNWLSSTNLPTPWSSLPGLTFSGLTWGWKVQVEPGHPVLTKKHFFKWIKKNIPSNPSIFSKDPMDIGTIWNPEIDSTNRWNNYWFVIWNTSTSKARPLPGTGLDAVPMAWYGSPETARWLGPMGR